MSPCRCMFFSRCVWATCDEVDSSTVFPGVVLESRQLCVLSVRPVQRNKGCASTVDRPILKEIKTHPCTAPLAETVPTRPFSDSREPVMVRHSCSSQRPPSWQNQGPASIYLYSVSPYDRFWRMLGAIETNLMPYECHTTFEIVMWYVRWTGWDGSTVMSNGVW